MSTYLYRHFAADGSLLYVGISLSWAVRTKAHASGSRWFDDVTEVRIEQFPTRQEALDAERKAIQRERPKFNIVHNRTPKLRPAAGLTRKPATEQRFDALGSLLRNIAGPHALVGPALLYREDQISVMVVSGTFGTAGHLHELVLGELFMDDLPEWTSWCDTVLTIRSADQITMSEARELRADIILRLRSRLEKVLTFDSDKDLAAVYADRFPSAKSRQVLNEIMAEAPL